MTLSGMNMLSDDSEDEVENIDPYRRKYQLLSERCEVLQQDNERLAFRTQETRKKRNRLRRLRKAIMDRLDKYGDAWRTAPLMMPDPAARVVIKTEKTSKTSSQKGTHSQKVKTTTPTASGSEKTPAKASKSSASSSGKKGKVTIKTEKPERDPNTAPKRPINPFFVFCNEQQPLLLQQLAEQRPGEPEPSKMELNKHLAVQWNTLTADERKIYYEVYEQSKEQYIQDVATFNRERQQQLQQQQPTTSTSSS